MLDIKLVRENPDLEKRDRKDLIKKLDEVILLDKKWRDSLQKEQEFRRMRNVLSQEIAIVLKLVI